MRYARIKPNDVVNGEGIMVSLYTQGCPHHCKGCFNVETWSYEGGKEFTEKERQKILEAIDARGIKRNFSVLGGEPLCPENIHGVYDICKDVKEMYPDIKIYVWTGYIFEHLISMYDKNIFQYFDVLIDGRFDIDKKDYALKLRGSSNQRVIDVRKTIDSDEIVLYDMR